MNDSVEIITPPSRGIWPYFEWSECDRFSLPLSLNFINSVYSFTDFNGG